ncbi:MAG: YfiR/HmsC family protein [Candidatus Kapabacteria bacterium]|nr:YfiR/HmsC family protein [Candidatus Kapabacteria bacterium]
MSRLNYIYITLAAIAFLFINGGESLSQQLSTPVSVHLPIMLKSLDYDRNLKNKNIIRIGIIYQENFRSSFNTKNQVINIAKELESKANSNFQFEFEGININKSDDIRDFIKTGNYDVVYIAPLRSVNVENLANILRQNKILALTGIAEYIIYAIPFIVDLDDNKPRLVIDLNNSKLSGADFNVSLLKLAKVINTNND